MNNFVKVLMLNIFFLNIIFAIEFEQKPIFVYENPIAKQSKIVDIDFHPNGKYFALVDQKNNSVSLLNFNRNKQYKSFQILDQSSNLERPQSVAFHPNGKILAVSNYNNSIVIFKYKKSSSKYLYRQESIFYIPKNLQVTEPHKIIFSPDGKYLASTYCRATCAQRKIIFYSFDEISCKISKKPKQILNYNESNLGMPKGITYSPDGKNFVVTTNLPAIILHNYDKESSLVNEIPKQIIKEKSANLVRPEDVKFSPDSSYIVVTNNHGDSVNFYNYDKNNILINPKPYFILKNPEAMLNFPHNIAFSPDGQLLFITNFYYTAGKKSCFLIYKAKN